VNVKNNLREARKKEGLTQNDIAAAAGISRQAYTAIELGKSVPSTEVALRLARKLHTRLEDLFYLDDTTEENVIKAELVSDTPSDVRTRVQLYKIGSRLLARPMVGDTTINPADAITTEDPDSDKKVNVRLLNKSFGHIPTLILSGCDLSIPIVASMMRERGVRLVWNEKSSIASLRALARGEAHVAGCHYRDKITGVYNVPVVNTIVPFPCTIIRFVKEQQGFIVPRGNPKSIHQIDDLVGTDITFINRQEGSGTRGLLHRLLNQKNLSPSDIKGHNNYVNNDMSVARVIQAELADCGMGVEASAFAAGLGFLPLAEEPYDFVIPDHFLNLPVVQILLDLLKSRELGNQLEMLGGYDTSLMGTAY
jgi:putative molybdopterin biosynthesis protein